jgi:glycosyltransferase involved in cell wall biosynthesis
LQSARAPRALIITALRLQNLDRNVHGVFQRLRLFVEAARASADELDILCLRPVPGRPQAGPDEETAAEVAREWGVRCRVLNGHWTEPPLVSPYLLEQARWIASYRLSRAFVGLDNAVNRAMLAQLLQASPSFVLAHKLPSIEFARGLVRDIPVLFDLDDIEHIAFQRHAEQITNTRERLVARASVPAIRRAVRHAVHFAARTFVCSAHDRHELERTLQLPQGRAVVVPNSAAIQPRTPVSPEPVLLFVGAFGWTPNLQAIEFFLARCWPRVHAAVPGARLKVVGRMPELIPSYARKPAGVEFAGFVPDIAAAYHEARVVICPIISGGGTRVKLVEAAAFGKPIVSTHVGAEGLDFDDGQHALLRDDPDQFADACIRLLQDEHACEALSAAVHEHARARFDRDSVLAAIRRTIAGCALRA